MAPGSDVAVSTGSLPTVAVCDACVCGCARQGPVRRESPPNPSEDLGRWCLQVLGVTLLPAEQMVITGPRSGQILSVHRVVAALDTSFRDQNPKHADTCHYAISALYDPLLYNKGWYSQSYGFPSGHVQMLDMLDHKEG